MGRSQQKTPFGRGLLSDEMVPSIVAEDGIALRVYCLLAEGPQNVVGASANSLWQGGWRRTHSVKGGLPK